MVEFETREIKLRCGGMVRLTVGASHFALSQHRYDREFVNDLLDHFTDYEALAKHWQPEEE